MPFVVLYLIIGIVFAVIGSSMARSRQRDAALWAVICFLFPLIGVLALALAGPASGASAGNTISNELVKKWSVLVELDPDIRAAAERVRTRGAPYEALLAQKYMAIGDKAYLKAAEEAVLRQAEQDEQNPAPLVTERKPLPFPLARKLGLVSLILAVISGFWGGIGVWLFGTLAYSAFLGSKSLDARGLLQISISAFIFGFVLPFVIVLVANDILGIHFVGGPSRFGTLHAYSIPILGIGCPAIAFLAGQVAKRLAVRTS